MELTSLREFYQKSEAKNIRLYQEYLATVKREISEGLAEAKKLLGDRDVVVVEIGEKISFIDKIEEIIANSIREIINNSIINMTDAELVKIIDDYIKKLNTEQDNNTQELDALNKKKDKIKQQYIARMNKLGYDENYYKAVDVDIFFREIKSAEDYTIDLVKSGLDRDALRATFSWLYTGTDIQEQLADRILSLRKIAKITDEKVLKKSVMAFLTPENLGKIVGIKEKNECMKSLETLQKELKMRTEFFERLPESLKEEIKNNGVMESEVYNKLLQFYLEYRKTGHIKMPVSAEVLDEENKIQELRKKMTELDIKIVGVKNACENRKGMMGLVESFIYLEDSGEYTYSKIATSAKEQRGIEQALNEKITKLTQELNDLEKIANKLNALLSDDYKEEFDILEAQREYQERFDDCESYKDIEIEAVKNAESRRLEQFKILGRGIATLKDLQKQIEDVDSKHNVIGSITGAKRKLKASLLEKYKDMVETIYLDLDEKDLLSINVVRNYMDAEEEFAIKPLCFESLISRVNVPKYVVNSDLFMELIEKRVVSEKCSQDEINESFEVAYNLAMKIFKATKKADGIYDFKISLEEIDELIRLYENLAGIYGHLFEMQERNRRRIDDLANKELDDNFQQLLDDVNLDLSTVTLEDINAYSANIGKRINNIRKEIVEIKGQMPESYCMDAQYEVLSGFDETCLSSTEIKKLVNFH